MFQNSFKTSSFVWLYIAVEMNYDICFFFRTNTILIVVRYLCNIVVEFFLQSVGICSSDLFMTCSKSEICWTQFIALVVLIRNFCKLISIYLCCLFTARKIKLLSFVCFFNKCKTEFWLISFSVSLFYLLSLHTFGGSCGYETRYCSETKTFYYQPSTVICSFWLFIHNSLAVNAFSLNLMFSHFSRTWVALIIWASR